MVRRKLLLGYSNMTSVFGVSIAYRHLVPFMLYVLVFSGMGVMVIHFPAVGLVWISILLVSLFIWSILGFRHGYETIVDQLSLAQLFLLVAHTWYVIFGPGVSTIGMTVLVVVLLTICFDPITIRLATIELTLIILFQYNILKPGHWGFYFSDSVIIAIMTLVVGFLLSMRESATSRLRPQETEPEPVIHVSAEGFVGLEDSEIDHANRDRLTIIEENSRETLSRIQQILEHVHDILRPFSVIYFGLHRNSGYLTPLSLVGDSGLIDLNTKIEIGNGPIGWAAKNGMHFSWGRSSGEGDPVYYQRRVGVRSLLATPVADEHMLSGVLVVDSTSANAFNAKDEKMIKVFTAQIALMFQIQKLALNKHMEASEFKLLHETGNRLIKMLNLDELLQDMLKQLQEILVYTSAMILLYNETTAKLHVAASRGVTFGTGATISFDLMEGVLGWVYQNREEPTIFSDVRKLLANQPLLGYGEPDIDGSSILFMPLLSSQQPIGMIVLISSDDHAFQGVSGHLLAILANTYSLSISNSLMYQQLEKQAITDGLTRLINHRRFQVILSDEFKRRERDPKPFALIMIDIDYFKKVNDTYGHPVGDQVLRTVATLLKRSCREIDVVARYGGEEFAVLLVNTDKDGAMLMAERIRQTIAGEIVTVNEHSLTITVSLGVASVPDDSETKQDLVDLADKALYQAKAEGRNRAVTADQLVHRSI